MSHLIEKWKAHRVASFFLLTLALNFLLLTPVVLLRDSLETPVVGLYTFYAGRLAVYSPVLIGMLMVRWLNPDRSLGSTTRRRVLFWAVWAVALAVFVLEAQDGLDEAGFGLEALVVFSLPIALLPAWVVSSALGRYAGIREYLSTLIRPRGHVIWYLIALFAFPVIHLVGHLATQLVTGEPLFADIRLTSEVLAATLLAFVFVFFYSGGINEEGGWRGFAQNQLQRTHSPLTANLLLYIGLVVWHIPNDIFQYADGGYIRVRIILYPFIVILFGWVYNRTNGSILAVAFFHASMNSTNTLQEAIPATTTASVLLILFAVYAVASDRMWKKLPSSHTKGSQPVVTSSQRP